MTTGRINQVSFPFPPRAHISEWARGKIVTNGPSLFPERDRSIHTAPFLLTILRKDASFIDHRGAHLPCPRCSTFTFLHSSYCSVNCRGTPKNCLAHPIRAADGRVSSPVGNENKFFVVPFRPPKSPPPYIWLGSTITTKG